MIFISDANIAFFKRNKSARALEISINGLAMIKVAKPTASVIKVPSTSTTDVRIASNRLRKALQATLKPSPANSAKPTSYLTAPAMTVSKKTPRGRTISSNAPGAEPGTLSAQSEQKPTFTNCSCSKKPTTTERAA